MFWPNRLSKKRLVKFISLSWRVSGLCFCICNKTGHLNQSDTKVKAMEEKPGKLMDKRLCLCLGSDFILRIQHSEWPAGYSAQQAGQQCGAKNLPNIEVDCNVEPSSHNFIRLTFNTQQNKNYTKVSFNDGVISGYEEIKSRSRKECHYIEQHETISPGIASFWHMEYLVCNIINRNCSSQIGLLGPQSKDTRVDLPVFQNFQSCETNLFFKQSCQLRYM